MMYLISSIHSPNKVGYLAGQFWVLRILRLVTAKVMYTLFFRNKEEKQREALHVLPRSVQLRVSTVVVVSCSKLMNYESFNDFNHESTTGVYHTLFKKCCTKCDVAIDFTTLHERTISSHRVKHIKVLELGTPYHLSPRSQKTRKNGSRPWLTHTKSSKTGRC